MFGEVVARKPKCLRHDTSKYPHLMLWDELSRSKEALPLDILGLKWRCRVHLLDETLSTN